MKRFISLILSFVTVLGMAAEGIPYCFKPTLAVDAAECAGEISSRASGYLYGIAQSGVPDPAMVESLDVSSVSQKVAGGLQHPVGDVDDVSGSLESCDYITVYLQDCFDTWYYCEQEIRELRADGVYDCEKFVHEKFFPQAAESVALLSRKNYSDRIVYCPFNECDNAVWFGTPSEDGSWLMFDEAAKLRFCKAWKEMFELIRSINPDALIGGPGYCDYNSAEIRQFLEYCAENACLPDVMIYHELSERSAAFWQDHVDDYRAVEKSLGVPELPIIVTEYGCMYECGAPADMLKYIVSIEKSGTYGNVAFWRLANNLCDTSADSTSPNSNWWLYRWYADMEGSLLGSEVIDILHADFANAVKYGYKRFHYSGFNGIASLNAGKNRIEAICGGCDYSSGVSFKNLDKTALGKDVRVLVECVYYEGLSGAVNAPTKVCEYSARTSFGKLRVELENPDPTAVYHIVLTPDSGETEDFFNTSLPVRVEFENGILSGGAYTYDSAYATTGLQNGMVGGLENPGDGVTVSFDIEKSGIYDVSLIFGNSNDGRTPAERTDTYALMTLDGAERQIAFPNTIKSEYTDKSTLVLSLEKGTHTLSLEHLQGTFVLDSLLISPHTEGEIAVLRDADRSVNGVSSFLAVAPDNGFYEMQTDVTARFTADGAQGFAENGGALVFLRKGLNYIDIDAQTDICTLSPSKKNGFTVSVNADELELSGSAELKSGKRGFYVDGISSNGGGAEFTVSVPRSGSYRMVVAYSNNLEGGVHSYNVDLIETYITVAANGRSNTLWCRNTYSDDTVKTAVINLELQEGENRISLTNDGSVRFNGTAAFAPHIYSVSVNGASE